jgi:hypothetical protein
LSKIPEIVKERGIPKSGIIIFGSSIIAFVGFSFGISLGEYFSPLHTNSFSLYSYWISNILVVVIFSLFII